jgi:hypothetical protein
MGITVWYVTIQRLDVQVRVYYHSRQSPFPILHFPLGQEENAR